MKWSEFIAKVANGFSADDGEGYSVKKMMAMIIVLVMLVISSLTCAFDKTFVLPLMGIWIPFVTALIITGAVEKNNILKSNQQDAKTSPPTT
jgi:uncharacterized membrane protein